MVVIIPQPAPPPPIPPIIQGCKYQIKVYSDTYKCFTEDEYKARQALTVKIKQEKAEAIRPVVEFINSYWWWLIAFVLAFWIIRKGGEFLLDHLNT